MAPLKLNVQSRSGRVIATLELDSDVGVLPGAAQHDCHAGTL